MKLATNEIIKGIALLIGGICIGIGIGVRATSPFNTWLSQGMDLAAMQRYAEIQFYSTAAPNGLKAQNEFLKHLDRAEANQNQWNTWKGPWMTTERLRYERALTFARIALTEEKAGHSQEANLYWVRAEDQAKLSQWKNPTRDYLRDVVKKAGESYDHSKQ